MLQLMSSFARFAFVSSTLVLAACGGGSDGTTSPNGSTSGFHMTAKIDGAAFVATSPSLIYAAQGAPGQYAITGLQSGTTNATIITLTLANIRGPGTYPLGVGPQVPGGSAILAISTAGWSSPMSGADGTITITSLSTTEIAGTFSFVVAASSSGATPVTRNVSEGDFRLQVKQLVVIGAIPDNAGSTLSLTANGVAYNAAFVQANVNAISGGNFLVLNSSTNTRGFGFTLSNVTGPGTYALGNTSTVTRQMQFSFVSNVLANTWNSLGAGSSGSVTITSMTATRIKGSFFGVLGPAPGFSSPGTATIANGVFDVGLP